MPTSEWLGPVAALSAALSWAISSVLYSRIPLPASLLTTVKNVFAAVLMGIVLSMASRGGTLFEATTRQWSLLAMSGIIGLVIGDIAFFRSLQILGARRGLTLTLLTPPITALMGEWMLGESLLPREWAAITLTLAGLGVVMYDRSGEQSNNTHLMGTGSVGVGIACAILGVFCQALGCIVMKQGTGELRTIEATFIRMVAAALVSTLLTSAACEWRRIGALFANRRATREIIIAAFLGTFIGVWLMLTAFKYSRAGIASTLTSTSPLFVIPIVWAFLGERVTVRATLGAMLAFGGVCWLG